MLSAVQLGAIGLSHRTAPVELREKFAVPEDQIQNVLKELIDQKLIHQGVLVSTCNRVEIYFTADDFEKASISLINFLKSKTPFKEDVDKIFYKHLHLSSIQHLYEVCCGLDSMVVGETEILGQIKDFYQLAHQSKCTGTILNKLFQSAFAVAKQIRSQTRIGMGSVSVGSVAADLASQIFGDLKNRTVMLVGAGEMSEITAKALQNRGARSLLITNRSFERAAKLAESLQGNAIPWDSWAVECSKVDVVVSSTSSPGFVVTKEKLAPILQNRNGSPLFLIDIAVPRDIERDVNQLEGVYLYDIDDLQVIADQNLAMRQKEIAVCKQIIREHVDKFQNWFKVRENLKSETMKSSKWAQDNQSGLAEA
jgi:glutamyl-tRNA reductase